MRSKERGFAGVIFGALSIILVLILIFGFPFIKNVMTHRDVDFTVTKSERIVTNNDSKYLVFTDNGVYENTDTIWNGKFNSSDLYANIKEGKKYTCDVVGWRVPFLSWYPNLISCEEHNGK